MKSILFAVIFILSSLYVLSQTADDIWYFGDHAGISFTSGTPTALSNGALQAWDNTSTISDGAGALVFYTNGVDAWDKTHNIMANGTALGGTLSSGQSALIVPQPFSDNYYIFTVGYASADAFRYSIVDISLNGGNGAVTTKANIIFNGSTEKIDAVYNPNDTSYWIMTHAWNSNQFNCYKLDSSGLNLNPVLSSIGSVHSGGTTAGYNAIGQMSFSEDGSKLANAIYSDGKIELFDFDLLMGTLSNSISMSGYTNSWGITYSPSNQYIYYTEWYDDKVWQFDISSGIASTIAATKTQVGIGTFSTGSSNYKIGYFQNGPDGKVYIAKFGQHYISAINNPDLQGTSCGFVDNAVHLGSNKVCNAGLSRTVKKYGWLNNCENTYFESHNVCLGDSIIIDGSYHTAPKILIDSFVDIIGCDSIRIYSLILKQLPIVKLGNDTTFCTGDTVILSVQPFYSVLWSTGATTDSIIVDSTGTYWVNVNDSICSNSDTISISNLSLNYINISDTTICDDESLNLSLPPQNQYLWYDGSTNSNIVIIDSGEYFVEITDICKVYTDSFSLTTEDCSCSIFIPNVFTPNGDGLNDDFYAVIGCDLDYYAMYIFNRWGQLIFESSDQYEVWDGKYEGKEVPDGVYFYLLESIHFYTSAEKQKMTGSVTIFR